MGTYSHKQSFIISSIIIVCILFGVCTELLAGDVKVKGYYRKDGTYVNPHYRSAPDGNPYNNWSFPGNLNPHTGEIAPGNPSTYMYNYCSESPNNPYCVGSYLNHGKKDGRELDYYKNYQPPSYYNDERNCQNGYRKSGNDCVKIYAPQNAYTIGDKWYCIYGYFKSGDMCYKK